MELVRRRCQFIRTQTGTSPKLFEYKVALVGKKLKQNQYIAVQLKLGICAHNCARSTFTDS